MIFKILISGKKATPNHEDGIQQIMKYPVQIHTGWISVWAEAPREQELGGWSWDIRGQLLGECPVWESTMRRWQNSQTKCPYGSQYWALQWRLCVSPLIFSPSAPANHEKEKSGVRRGNEQTACALPLCWPVKPRIRACAKERQEAIDYMRWSPDAHFIGDSSKVTEKLQKPPNIIM